MDAVATVLLQRVGELLTARQDLSRAEFGRRIARGHSWLSEFLGGQRTTNDLRLVIKIARVFGVSVGYLLGETADPLDPGAATLVATWDALKGRERERALLLNVAASFRQLTAPIEPPDAAPGVAPPDARGRTRTKADEPPKRKR